jgi:hypothetical protein
MCDYSLHTQPNRLALEGERLITHRFNRGAWGLGGSLGLASPSDLAPRVVTTQRRRHRLWVSWTGIKTWLRSGRDESRAICAVCVPPGSRLVVRDIPQTMQGSLRVGETEEVTFVQLSANEFTYRDAIRFGNGSTALLQQLNPGQRVDVLCLQSSKGELEPESCYEIPEVPA